MKHIREDARITGKGVEISLNFDIIWKSNGNFICRLDHAVWRDKVKIESENIENELAFNHD